MEGDVHTVLDLLTLVATGYIIFLMMTSAKATWQADKDTLWEVYIVRSRSLLCASLTLCSLHAAHVFFHIG